MNIVNVGYSSTNYYVIEAGSERILIDVGLPKSYPQLVANLKRMDIALPSIRHLLVTHYHLDHAGIVEEVKAAGVRLIVLAEQIDAIHAMNERYNKAKHSFTPIRLDNNMKLTTEASRAFLKGLGFDGEIIATPGHSDDSVTLVLDEGAAFIGDLTQIMMAGEENEDQVHASWEALRASRATRIYPGHGEILPIKR